MSFERDVLEFVQDKLVDSVELNDFISTLPNSPGFLTFIGIDDKEPPSLEENVVCVVWTVKVIKSDDSRLEENQLILSIGHYDEEYIDFETVHKQQRGKLNNSDLAELTGIIICKEIQKTFGAKCSLNIEQLLDNYFPNFVHQITINFKYPKTYRTPLF